MPSPRRERRYWAPIVAEFEPLGISHAEFCRARGLTLPTFRRWLYRLRREGEQAAPRFVEVRESRSDIPCGGACVLVLGNAKLTFRALPPPEYLVAVLRGVARTEP